MKFSNSGQDIDFQSYGIDKEISIETLSKLHGNGTMKNP